jgi:serine/threonine-protein kinase RsbW
MVESISVDQDCVDSICLAVGEAASNAVRHGCRGNEELKVGVECSTDGRSLVVEIRDPGSGFDPEAVPAPFEGELREGGMGIHFMRLMMDEVAYDFGEGTKVRLMKRLAAPTGMDSTSTRGLFEEGDAPDTAVEPALESR